MNNKRNCPIVGFLCGGNSWGGLEMNVLRLARWLQKRGQRIILYSEKDSPLYSKSLSQGLTVRPVNSQFKYRSLLHAPKLAKQLRQDGVEVAVLHTNRQLLFAVLAKILSRNRFKLVYQQHMHLGGSKRDLFHRWEYGKIDSWIVPLNMFAKRIARQTAIPPERISVIPFGIEIERFRPGILSRADARKAIDLPKDALIVGVIGRIDRLKGQDILIQALSELHEKGLEAYILIMGNPTQGEGAQFAEHLVSLTNKLGLNEFVHFRPHRDDISIAYRAIDIFALTTYSETYGMVTVEAMASGLPVVGTNDGGTMEIIKSGINGLLVKPGDPKSLARALLTLGQDQKMRESLGRQAQEIAAKEYGHLKQCERFEKLMLSLQQARK